MTREPKPVDVTNIPELLSIAQEVHDTRQSCLLQRNGQDLAVLMPVPPSAKRKGRPVSKDAPLFRLIGIGRSGIPGSVSSRKHEFLARAYRRQ